MTDPVTDLVRSDAKLTLANQCFTIFEGGGAKGITHLGALKALEDTGLERIGTAGTSAGAIIAALTAVGFTADELFVSGSQNILASLHKTPLDLLGRDDWSVFSKLRGAPTETPIGRMMRTGRRWAMIALLSVIPPLVPLWVFCLSRTIRRPVLLAFIWRVIDDFGFFSTESARDILNAIFCKKLGLPEGTLVCFRHIDPVRQPTCCRLKIITTNLDAGGLELFDHTTPDVVVADAVAASFSIPVFFKPTRIRRLDDRLRTIELPSRYADGGLVSNLPVWVFYEDKKSIERSVDNRDRRPLPIVAFQLAKKAVSKEPKGQNVLLALLSYIGNVVITGIFGGQPIAENFVTHLTIVELPTELGVVQFDCSGCDALKAYKSGRETAEAKLKTVFRENPKNRFAILEKLIVQATALSAAMRPDGTPPNFRASILRRLGNRSFKVIASINMDGDTDDDLVLDDKNPGGPTAFHDKDVTYVDVRGLDPDLRMTKYERALVRRTLAGIISAPIFKSTGDWRPAPKDRTEPSGVLCIDSDVTLEEEYGDIAFMRMLTSIAVELAPYMVFEKETS